MLAWPDRIWAVEDANGLGRPLSRQLVEAVETVIDVPAKSSARVRALSGARHETDPTTPATPRSHADVRSVSPVVADGEMVLLGSLVERRHHIPSHRQKTLCRIHDQLVALTPGGANRRLTVTKVAEELRRIRPPTPSGLNRRRSRTSSIPRGTIAR